MPKKPVIYNLMKCGPSDVAREIKTIGEVVDAWNRGAGLDSNYFVHHHHWSTDAAPDLSARPQAVINDQLIDKCDLVVAVFWKRFGSPTGIAASGTQEEIERAIAQGRRVLVYFSDIEDIRSVDQSQLRKVQQFREKLRPMGLCWSFKSRVEFEKLFRTHLQLAVQDLISRHTPKPERKKKPVAVSQKGMANANITGDGNEVTQTIFNKAPVFKSVVPPPSGAVTSAQKIQISSWVDDLVKNTTGMQISEAKAMWWSRLKKKADVTRYEDILSSQMQQVEEWYRKNRGIGVRKLRRKATNLWEAERIKAIKSAMSSMGRSNDNYYPEIAMRLKMPKLFKSIKELTKADLERVYQMVMRDSR